MLLWRSEFEEKAKNHFKNAAHLAQDTDAQLAQVSFKKLGEIASNEGDLEEARLWYEKGSDLMDEPEFEENISEPSSPLVVRKSSLSPNTKLRSVTDSMESFSVSVRAEGAYHFYTF